MFGFDSRGLERDDPAIDFESCGERAVAGHVVGCRHRAFIGIEAVDDVEDVAAVLMAEADGIPAGSVRESPDRIADHLLPNILKQLRFRGEGGFGGRERIGLAVAESIAGQDGDRPDALSIAPEQGLRRCWVYVKNRCANADGRALPLNFETAQRWWHGVAGTAHAENRVR